MSHSKIDSGCFHADELSLALSTREGEAGWSLYTKHCTADGGRAVSEYMEGRATGE